MTRFMDIIVCLSPFWMGGIVGHFYGLAAGLAVALVFGVIAFWVLATTAEEGEDYYD